MSCHAVILVLASVAVLSLSAPSAQPADDTETSEHETRGHAAFYRGRECYDVVDDVLISLLPDDEQKTITTSCPIWTSVGNPEDVETWVKSYMWCVNNISGLSHNARQAARLIAECIRTTCDEEQQAATHVGR